MESTDRDADNTSPDSGVDLDLKSSSSLLDPSRRLTPLLKSLSQDSEYSLDTSLFDAEEFLQDMGFAGTADPTIPDRFLPSLMQRLSRFPESEMESLHDRIIQSIGCFRRKEGKRRLFRNLSMGKDPRGNFSRHLLGFPSNNYPLLRSNTDPSTFPYEDTSSDSLQSSSRVSSNDSRLHSLGSSKEDSEFPESPIAILVSAASVDQESCSQLQTTAAETQTSLDDAALQDDSSKSEFASTVEKIQKLTHKIANQDIRVSRDLDDDVSPDLNAEACRDLDGNVSNCLDDEVSRDLSDDVSHDLIDDVSYDLNEDASHDLTVDVTHDADGDVSHDKGDVAYQFGNEIDSDELSVGIDPAMLSENYCSSEVKQADSRTLSEVNNPFMEFSNSESGSHDYSSLKYIHASRSDESLARISDIRDNICGKSDKPSNVKTPLRRISTVQFPISKSFRKFAQVDQTDVDSSLNAFIRTRDEESQHQSRNKTSHSKAKTIDGDLTSGATHNSDASLNDASEHERPVSAFLPFQNVPKASSKNFCKPKYSRDDSLTNFLSSMLNTSDVTSDKLSINPINPVLENNCSSDSEIPGSFASSPFISPFSKSTNTKSVGAKSKSQPNKIPRKISSTFAPDKNLEANNKAPNRKRRVLRRMSSSLQCCDDINCSDSKGLQIDSFENNAQKSTLPLENYRQPILTHEGIKSASSCHQAIHPCNSVPVINICHFCSTHYAEDSISFPKNISRNYDCGMDCERKSIYFRKCKRKRNLSCPLPGVSLNRGVWRKPEAEMQPLHAARCDCGLNQNQPVFSKCNQNRSFIYPYNLSQEEACTDTCCNKDLLCKRNRCCAAPRANIFYSANSENLDSNTGYFSSLSPLTQPKNSPFIFESNLMDQSRHFCYSNPELRHECCSVVPNPYEKHCKHRPLRDLDESGFNPFYKTEKLYEERNLKTSLRQEKHSFDGVFSPDPNHCDSLQYNKYPSIKPECPIVKQECHVLKNEYPGIKEDFKKDRVYVRTPQRQHSISVADSEVRTQDCTPDVSVFPCLQQTARSSPFITDSVEGNILPPPTAMSLSKDNISNYQSVTKAFQLQDVPPIQLKTINKPSPTAEASVTKTEDSEESAHPTSHSNKSEALLERKIRIFSKFLANLGNLSKSTSDTDIDNKHKSTRDTSIVSDKRTRSRVSKVSCPAARKRSISSPEFGKLLSLLKSMDCGNSDPKNGIGSEKTEVPEAREVSVNSPVYENKVLLQTCIDENRQRLYQPVLFTSSVSLYVNGEDKKDIHINRNPNSHSGPRENRLRELNSLAKDRNSQDSSTTMSFKGVSKEIEDLQLSIQKAKEMRICASKELQLLQKLLSVEDVNHEIGKEKKLPGDDSKMSASSRTFDVTRALTDLREKSKKEVLEDTSFWKEEINRVKDETRQEWQSKLDRMESRLCAQEEELRRLQGENEALRREESPVQTAEGGNGRTDSAFEDDEELHKAPPSIPIHSTRQECDRLQERLLEEEQRADQLNLMLNQKLIELSKIQITLSKQTKEMIELEKSYVQLQCRLRKSTSKPLVERLCSRSSPFASKNLYPKPSPPASPHPPANEAS